jgi:hypothetical protein
MVELAEGATVEVWLSFSAGDASHTAVINHEAVLELGGMCIDLVLDPYPPGGKAPRVAAGS